VGDTQNTASTCGVSPPQSTSYKILSCMFPSRYLSGVVIWQDVRGSNSDRAKIYFSTLKTKPTLGPNQPPTRWVLKTIGLGVKGPGREAHHLLQSSAGVKNVVASRGTIVFAFLYKVKNTDHLSVCLTA
jgi:hypothetical protein